MIEQYCPVFACFLQEKALLDYNDVYGDYLEQLVAEEWEHVSIGGKNDVLLGLMNAKKAYDDQA